MELKKHESIGSYLKKGEDIKENDILEITTSGREVEGQYGTQYVSGVKKDKTEGNVSFNQSTLNNLIDGYGSETENWIGKKVKVFTIKQNVQGKIRNVYYFLHPDSELDEQTGLFMISKQHEKQKTNKDDLPF